METGKTATTRTAKGTVETVELSKLEQTAARRAAESKATIPHIYLDAEVELGDDAGASIGSRVVVACAAALRETPRLNGAYRDGKLELYSRINVAISVPAPAAAQSPTIFDADTKTAAQIAAEIEGLASRAGDRSITAPELSGATFTVLDLSESAAVGAQGVVSPGQAAILAVGAPTKRGDPSESPVLRLGLACDHRVVGSAEAAAFLGRVTAALEQPATG